MVSDNETIKSRSGSSGADRGRPAFYATSAGWFASISERGRTAAPPVAAAAPHGGEAWIGQAGVADCSYATGQRDERGETVCNLG